MAADVWDFVTCAYMLMHAIAHGGCSTTTRESALKVDSGRKIPCCTGESNLRQYCAELFGPMCYQLSHLAPFGERSRQPGSVLTGGTHDDLSLNPANMMECYLSPRNGAAVSHYQ